MANKVYLAERRQSIRFPVTIPISYFAADSENSVYIKTRDISEEGLCLVAHKPLPVGAYLDIYIQLIDTGEKIYKRGRIVWLSSVDPDKYRVGIKLEPPKIKPIPIALRTIRTLRELH